MITETLKWNITIAGIPLIDKITINAHDGDSLAKLRIKAIELVELQMREALKCQQLKK